MKKHIENIIIGNPIVPDELIFGTDDPNVWEKEKDMTIWTEERSLARIIGGDFIGSYTRNGEKETINLEFAKSVSEVRRNRKDLSVMLDKLDYIEIKYGKKRLFILVGK